MGLALQMGQSSHQRRHPRVRQVPHHSGADPVPQPDKRIDPLLLFGHTGEEAAGHHALCVQRDPLAERAVHPPGMGFLGLHRPFGIEGDAGILRCGEAHRQFFSDVALIDTGEETRIRAVIEIGKGRSVVHKGLLIRHFAQRVRAAPERLRPAAAVPAPPSAAAHCPASRGSAPGASARSR